MNRRESNPLNAMINVTNPELLKEKVDRYGSVTVISSELFFGNKAYLSKVWGENGTNQIKLGRAMMLEKAYPKVKISQYSDHEVTSEEKSLFKDWLRHEEQKHAARKESPKEEPKAAENKQISLEEYTASMIKRAPEGETPLTREAIGRVLRGEDPELRRWIYGLYQELRDEYEKEKARLTKFTGTYYGKETMR